MARRHTAIAAIALAACSSPELTSPLQIAGLVNTRAERVVMSDPAIELSSIILDGIQMDPTQSDDACGRPLPQVKGAKLNSVYLTNRGDRETWDEGDSIMMVLTYPTGETIAYTFVKDEARVVGVVERSEYCTHEGETFGTPIEGVEEHFPRVLSFVGDRLRKMPEGPGKKAVPKKQAGGFTI